MLQMELELTTHLDVKACKAVPSDFITAKFEDELELSKCYTAKGCKDECNSITSWVMWHQKISQHNKNCDA